MGGKRETREEEGEKTGTIFHRVNVIASKINQVSSNLSKKKKRNRKYDIYIYSVVCINDKLIVMAQLK